MAPLQRLLEAYRKGVIDEGALHVRALLTIDEANVTDFLKSMTGAEARGFRDFVDQLSDAGSSSPEAFRTMLVEAFANDDYSGPDTLGRLEASTVERARRAVEFVRVTTSADAPIGGERDKDRTILQTIERLDLTARGWIIDDPWEADLLAIGVRSAKDADRLVYVSTFFTVSGRYCFDCDEISEESNLGYVTLDQGDDVTFAELLSAMRKHLDERGAAG